MSTTYSKLHNTLKPGDLLDSMLVDDDPIIVQLKNDHRLKRINMPIRVMTRLETKTSPLARLMRREWNYVSVKLFLNSLDADQCERIKENLSELQWQAADLLDSLESNPMFHGIEVEPFLVRRTMDVEIIHPLLAQWLRCIKIIDNCYVILIAGEKSKRIARKTRWEIVAPVSLAYRLFKAAAMNVSISNVDGNIESEETAE